MTDKEECIKDECIKDECIKEDSAACSSKKDVKLRKCKMNSFEDKVLRDIIHQYYYGNKMKCICSEYNISTTTIYNIIRKKNKISQDDKNKIKHNAKIQRLIDTNKELIKKNEELIKKLKE
jgi:hypothetical protein